MGSPPRLQGEDGIDDWTTRFLLRANLALKKEEEKVRRREREEAEYEGGYAGAQPTSSGRHPG